MYKLDGRYKEAVQDYSTLLVKMQTEEDAAAALMNRAYCYGRLNDYIAAVHDYTAVLKGYPQEAHCLFNRGICYEKVARFDDVSHLLL